MQVNRDLIHSRAPTKAFVPARSSCSVARFPQEDQPLILLHTRPPYALPVLTVPPDLTLIVHARPHAGYPRKPADRSPRLLVVGSSPATSDVISRLWKRLISPPPSESFTRAGPIFRPIEAHRTNLVAAEQMAVPRMSAIAYGGRPRTFTDPRFSDTVRTRQGSPGGSTQGFE